MREIVIVGGGAGAVLVVDALRRVRTSERVGVLVYEGRHCPGRGVPYRTADPAHRMNVPVARLSVDPDDPDHLLRWLRADGQTANPAEYIPRGLYGRYLEAVLAGTPVDRRLVDVQVVASPVVGIARTDTGLEVRAAEAPPALVREVVLAVGAPPVATPLPIDPALRGDPAVVSDPWAPGALGGGPRRWLVAGTGLTMVDVALTALRRPGTTVDAFSRHGELPRAHPGRRIRATTPIDVPPGRLTATGLGRALRDHAAAEPNGWQASVDLFRDRSGELWPRLSAGEQAKLLRRIGLWNVHRHRTSPQVGRELDRAIASGRLRIHAGHVECLRRSEDGTGLTARLRHRGCIAELRGDRFVACTGPSTDIARTDDPLVRQLLDSGLARVGPHRLGLAVDGCGRAIDADGRVVEELSVIGALRKGTVFETTAIPELREQAVELVRRLAV